MCKPGTIVFDMPGTTCLDETVEAFKKLGHDVRVTTVAEDADLLVLPGGFTYGDAVAPGKIAAEKFGEGLRSFRGRVLGICNGFQMLIHAGLLSGEIAVNSSGIFECAQRDYLHLGIRYRIPTAHKFGRYSGAESPILTDADTGEIAGVASADRRIVGIMPHPERAIDDQFGSSDGLGLLRGLLA